MKSKNELLTLPTDSVRCVYGRIVIQSDNEPIYFDFKATGYPKLARDSPAECLDGTTVDTV